MFSNFQASRTLPAAFNSMLRMLLRFYYETMRVMKWREHLLVCQAQLLREGPPPLHVRLADTLIQVLQGIQLGLSKVAATPSFLLRLSSCSLKTAKHVGD